MLRTFLLALVAVGLGAPAWGDMVVFERGGLRHELSGKVIATHEAGVLLHTPDGKMWPIEQTEIVRREKNDEPFQLLDKQELAEVVRSEMPQGSQVLETSNYLVVYNTSRPYAQWVAGMLERLHRGFHAYWTQRGFRLQAPEQPLVALVFDSQASFAEYAQAELGEAAGSVIGYYSMHSNYVVTYDLTGHLSEGNSRRALGLSQINRLMLRPDFQWSLATVVHEATHQLAFSAGLQQRFADVPLWFSEGLAMYFETPDLSSSRGWRGIGKVSAPRLTRFQAAMQKTGEPFLPDMLQDDDALRQAATALDRYAQAWAVTYYLQTKMPEQYDAYLKELSQIQPLDDPGPAARVPMFQRHFGADLDKLEADIRQMMQTLRP